MPGTSPSPRTTRTGTASAVCIGKSRKTSTTCPGLACLTLGVEKVRSAYIPSADGCMGRAGEIATTASAPESRASRPPMLCPIAKTDPWALACSTVARTSSRTDGPKGPGCSPWPGRSGTAQTNPASVRASAKPSMLSLFDPYPWKTAAPARGLDSGETSQADLDGPPTFSSIRRTNTDRPREKLRRVYSHPPPGATLAPSGQPARGQGPTYLQPFHGRAGGAVRPQELSDSLLLRTSTSRARRSESNLQCTCTGPSPGMSEIWLTATCSGGPAGGPATSETASTRKRRPSPDASVSRAA